SGQSSAPAALDASSPAHQPATALGHLLGCPWRIPAKLDFYPPVVGNDLPELELDVVDDLVGHGAGGRRHRHPDVHPALAGGESVDEADVDDGHRDLRVVDLVEGGHQWRPKRFVATVRHLVVRLPKI